MSKRFQIIWSSLRIHLQPSLLAARDVPAKRAVPSGEEREQTAVFAGYILSSLVPKPIRAKRVSRGGLEPTSIAQGLAKRALIGEKKAWMIDRRKIRFFSAGIMPNISDV